MSRIYIPHNYIIVSLVVVIILSLGLGSLALWRLGQEQENICAATNEVRGAVYRILERARQISENSGRMTPESREYYKVSLDELRPAKC